MSEKLLYKLLHIFISSYVCVMDPANLYGHPPQSEQSIRCDMRLLWYQRVRASVTAVRNSILWL